MSGLALAWVIWGTYGWEVTHWGIISHKDKYELGSNFLWESKDHRDETEGEKIWTRYDESWGNKWEKWPKIIWMRSLAKWFMWQRCLNVQLKFSKMVVPFNVISYHNIVGWEINPWIVLWLEASRDFSLNFHATLQPHWLYFWASYQFGHHC